MSGDLDRFRALVIGPGLGRAEGTISSARALIGEATLPVVIDGDGIFAAAWSADGAGPLLRQRGRPTVITPHDGEFALLAGHAPGADRVADARALAADLQVVVLLKGPTTVVASTPAATCSSSTTATSDWRPPVPVTCSLG